MSSDDIAPTPSTARPASFRPRAARSGRTSFAKLARGKSVGGRYIVLDELGRGGMAIVYRAYDPELDRLVALKLILRREDEALASERLLREAHALAQLSHPNVVAVYDVGTFGASVFVAMELVEGSTLRAWLRHEIRSTGAVIDHFVAAGEGLAAAHRARIVHRDFKPSNVLLGSDGRVRVADFGLARSVATSTERADSTPGEVRAVLADGGQTAAAHRDATPSDITVADRAVRPTRTSSDQHRTAEAELHAEASPVSASSRDRSADQLTAAGAIMGTPEYMSPEQNRGEPVDEVSDQYSYCVSLFEALFGRTPLDGEDVALAARQSSVRSDVPRRVRAVLKRGLSTAREDRFPSMQALLTELRAARRPPRSWWPAMVAGVVMVTAAVVGYRNVHGRQEMLCRGAAAKLSSIWNADRQRAIRETFATSGVPYAEHAVTTVSAALDDYARKWALAYADACEATRLRGEQSEDMLDRRMACLEQRRSELDATADVLSHADRTVLENAAQSVRSLTPVSACDDLARLAAREMPADATTRGEVERSWGVLGRARALLEAGRYVEGEPLARAAVARAESIHYFPLEADAQLTLAEFLDARGAYASAEHTLRQALRAAQVGGAREVSAAAWIDLVKVVGVRLQRHDEGHEWARDAEAELETLPGPTAMLGRLLSEESALLYQEGKLAMSVRTGRRARGILERTVGAEAPEVAEVLKTIGNAEADLGNDEEARVNYEQARAIWEKAVGPLHPAVAAAWNNLGNLLLERGSYDAALGHYRHALGIWEGALGSDHPNVAIARTNIGESLRALGDREGAVAAFRASLSIRTRALGADHPLCAGNLANLGTAALDGGDYLEAERSFEQALGIWQARFGQHDLHLATALIGLGDAFIGQRKYRRALAVYERSLIIDSESLGENHPDLAEPLSGLGQAYLGLHQPERAREKLERALSLLERRPPDPVLLATLYLGLAQALWQQGDRTQALRLAQAARDGWMSLGRRGEKGLRETDAFLTAMR